VKLVKRNIPPVLWIALASLGVMIVAKIVLVGKVGPIILVDAALSAALLAGLYLGHKWAYILTMVFVVIGAVLAFLLGVQHGITILVLDCLVLVPVLICTSYFFPKSLDTVEEEQEEEW